MDHLWTPWRYAYVSTAEKASGCVFCDAVNAGDATLMLIEYPTPQMVATAVCGPTGNLPSVK